MSGVDHGNVCFVPALIGSHVSPSVDGLTRVSALEADISDCFSTPVHRGWTIIKGLPGFPMSGNGIVISVNTKQKDSLSYAFAVGGEEPC